jgi:hypothetical protein
MLEEVLPFYAGGHVLLKQELDQILTGKRYFDILGKYIGPLMDRPLEFFLV